MALNQEQQSEVKGLMEINAKDFYWDKLRPAFIEYNRTYNSDPELNKTIDKAINMADSASEAQKYDEVVEAMQTLMVVVGDKGYMNRHMKTATDEEKQAISDMLHKIDDIIMIIQNEPAVKKEEPEIRERLNYTPNEDDVYNGRNNDFRTHNMDSLNEPNPAKPELNMDKKRKGSVVGKSVTQM